MIKKVAKKMMNKTTPLDNYRFHIDSINEEQISGWANKVNDDAHHPMIEVRSGDTVLWRTVANVYREDLLAAGIGNGEYGFALVPTAEVVTEAISSISLYIDGYLAQADVPFVMAPVMVEVPVDLEEVAVETVGVAAYRVHLDHYELDVVRGWVFKEDQAHYRAKVEVRCGDAVIASGLADNYREDLEEANIGDGAYGFSLTPQLAAFPDITCECRLFVDGELTAIEPFVLEATQEQIDEAAYNEIFAAEIAEFNASVETTLAELKQDIQQVNRQAGQDDFAVQGQLQVAMKSIAALSVRMKTIENALVKEFSAK